MTEMVVYDTGYMPAPVPCYQWQDEFERVLDLYREREPKSVLEIGTYCGGTLYHWLQNAVDGTLVVSLDSYAIAAATGGVDNRALYDSWTPPNVELLVIDANSAKEKTIERVRREGPYDWIFIDAGHMYYEVASDWHNYRPMAAEEAVVVFHDILPPSRSWPDIQVSWLWKELKREGLRTEEIVADWEAEWGGLGIVYL